MSALWWVLVLPLALVAVVWNLLWLWPRRPIYKAPARVYPFVTREEVEVEFERIRQAAVKAAAEMFEEESK